MSARRRHPKVRIKWESRTDPQTGHRYAILRWTEAGKRLSRRLGYLSEEAAEEARGDLEAALRLRVDSPTDSSVVRVRDVLAAYLAELEGRPVSEGYAELELVRCRRLRDHLGHLAAEEVTSSTLARYLGDRRRQPTRHGRPPKRSSLAMELDTIRRAYRTALERRLITGTVPAVPTGRLPDDKRPARRLTEAEVGRLIEAGHRDASEGERPWLHVRGLGWILQVLAWSGRRPVAILDLEVADLERLLDDDLPRSEQLVLWRRDKGGVSRGWGPITEPARLALVERAAEVGEGRLWPDLRCARDLHRPLRRIARVARVDDVQPYDLRRFAVTQILAQCGGEGGIRAAMRFTGHTQPSTLLSYTYAHHGEAEDLAGQIGWTPKPLQLVEDDEG